MNNQQSIGMASCSQDDMEKNITLLAKQIYNDYPDFDSQSFLSLTSVIYKQQSIDTVIQDFEINFLRPNAYKLNTFTDFIILLTEQQQSITSKRDIISLVLNTTTKLNMFLKETKEQHSQNNANYELNTCERKQYCQEIINIITDEALSYKHNHQQSDIEANGQQLTFGTITENIIYSISPTQGLAFLNHNPYRFFVEKILDIKTNNDWEENVNARLYGIIMHEIMYAYAIICKKKKYEEIDSQLFLNTAMSKLLAYKLDNDIVLQAKLNTVATIAVEMEKNAKQQALEVLCETNLSHMFDKIKITAKADRIEINHKTKKIHVYDYKTGQPPEQYKEINGEKTQLAIIAILLLHQERYKNYNISEMQYIGLSGREKDRNISNIPIEILPKIENNLLNLKDYFFTDGKPNYDKFIELKPTSFTFDTMEQQIKYLSRISKFITIC